MEYQLNCPPSNWNSFHLKILLFLNLVIHNLNAFINESNQMKIRKNKNKKYVSEPKRYH